MTFFFQIWSIGLLLAVFKYFERCISCRPPLTTSKTLVMDGTQKYKYLFETCEEM